MVHFKISLIQVVFKSAKSLIILEEDTFVNLKVNSDKKILFPLKIKGYQTSNYKDLITLLNPKSLKRGLQVCMQKWL